MGLSEAISEVLAADESVAEGLTGGVYAYAQIGRNGLSRLTTPAAYDAGGFLKPCAVVQSGSVERTTALRDDSGGTRQRVEVHLYDDGDSGFSTIRTAAAAVVAALDKRWIAGVGYARHAGGVDDQRDPKLNNAALVRVDFDITK